jgi:hypothetical protein
MQLRSTIVAAQNREISALAVIETIAACFLTVWLAAVVLQTWVPLTIICAFAPLLLIQTDLSTERAVRWYNTLVDSMNNKQGTGEIHGSLIMPKMFLPCLLFPVCIRIASAVYTAFQSPFYTIQEIPRNWTRIAFYTDIFHPPEVIAGIETSYKLTRNLRELRVTALWSGLLISKNLVEAAMRFLLLFFFYIFALPYRYLLKSTAIVWLPILWIIPHFTARTPLKKRLTMLNRSSWGRLVALFSTMTLLLIITKLIAFRYFLPAEEWWDVLNVIPLVYDFLQPYSFPIWQVAIAINSLLAIAMFFVASNYLILLEDSNDDQVDFEDVDFLTRIGAVGRAALSLYTISCILYIVTSQIEHLHLPRIGSEVFPWLYVSNY